MVVGLSYQYGLVRFFIQKICLNSFNFQDTAGQERFRALGYKYKKIFFSKFYLIFSPLYYREANGAILVFDITDEDSFNQVYLSDY